MDSQAEIEIPIDERCQQCEVPTEDYTTRTAPLLVPTLGEARDAISKALQEDYMESSVDIVDCPNLKEWGLCQRGLGGRGVIVDVGGEPFNHDPAYNQKVRFDMSRVADAVGFPASVALGAGACCSEVIGGHWGELTITTDFKDGINFSTSAMVDHDTHCCITQRYNSHLHGGICNLHLTEGLPGTTLCIKARGRREGRERSLPQTIRRALSSFPGAIGMGGVFKVLGGKIKAHVQPDLCLCPHGYYSVDQMNCVKPFLQFYEGANAMGPDLVCLTSLWTRDPTGGALHLRASGEHTHFFSTSGRSEAGHYHGDDPTHEPKQDIVYEGYFALAAEVARVRDAVAEKLGDTGMEPTVAVLGAGAMGCLLGGKLAEGGLQVTFIDTWKDHVDAMNSKGLKLVGKGGERVLKVNATSDIKTLGTFDVIIVQCKATDTKSATESAKHLFHEGTIAVSFQNGLGNEDIMAEVLGSADKVFGGQTLEGANMEGPGVARIHTNLASVMGEWRGGTSERCSRLCQIFTRAGLRTEEDANMRKKIWMKAIYNCVVSPLSTLCDLTHRDVYCRDNAIDIAEIITKEALAVARAEGVNVSDKEARECIDKVIASNQANKSSMCMDILAKRRSEIEFINGRVAFLAEKHGIPAPFNRAMVYFVKALQIHYAPDPAFHSEDAVLTGCFKPLRTFEEPMQMGKLSGGKVMKVAVLGAGANACLFGGLLAHGGLDVTFLDRWQEHIDKLNSSGLKLTLDDDDSRVINVKAVPDANEAGTFDVVLLSCNSADTRAAIESAKTSLHRTTLIVSFQNGLGSVDTIADVVGSSENILIGQTLFGATIEGPGSVRANSKAHSRFPVYIGEVEGGINISDRCKHLCDLFSDCGVQVFAEADMQKRLWKKLACTCVTAPLSALTKHGIQKLFKCYDVEFLANSILEEVCAVAQKVGVTMTAEESREYIRIILATDQNNTSSMFNDIAVERNTEINFINGAIVASGKEHEVQTPFNLAMQFFVKAVESHYHGIPTEKSKFPHVVDCDASTDVPSEEGQECESSAL
jgi:2-dehydropantoate 2-reductase